jgi:hypothetical protein
LAGILSNWQDALSLVKTAEQGSVHTALAPSDTLAMKLLHRLKSNSGEGKLVHDEAWLKETIVRLIIINMIVLLSI